MVGYLSRSSWGRLVKWYWNFDIDRVSESREQCAAQAILDFQNSYLVNLGIGKRRAVCQFPFRLSVLRFEVEFVEL